MSSDSGRPEYQFIDSRELAARWAVPETWIRKRVRTRCEDPLPHVRFGKYVRFRLAPSWKGGRTEPGESSNEQEISKQVGNGYGNRQQL